MLLYIHVATLWWRKIKESLHIKYINSYHSLDDHSVVHFNWQSPRIVLLFFLWTHTNWYMYVILTNNKRSFISYWTSACVMKIFLHIRHVGTAETWLIYLDLSLDQPPVTTENISISSVFKKHTDTTRTPGCFSFKRQAMSIQYKT